MSDDPAFDYIVIGAGTAGCVLAARLSENAEHRVLLLEAGGADKRREIHIPVAFQKLFKSEVDWAYETEAEPHLDGRRLFWPRGKVLGGCSSINAMIYIRGHRRDFDHWAELGNDGWGFDDVLPYFKKNEHQERGASDFHGAGGPLSVADLRDPSPLSHAFVDAAVEAGFARNDDFNGAEQSGFGLYQVTQRGGRRHSAADAYLRPALGRPSLVVETGAQATAITFEGRRATGVRYVQGGVERRARARAEVVLAGGAINSPQLLLLSGVGPAESLRALGIPVVHDLPGVGQNLQDHLAAGTNYACTRPLGLNRAEGLGSVLRYLLFRRGMLSSNVGEAGGFFASSAEQEAPDLQLIFGPAYYIDHGFTQPEGDGFTLGPILLQPESRGQVRLKSPDPLAAAAVEANYCAAEHDLERLVEGLRVARRIAAAPALAPFNGGEHTPGVEVRSDDELRAYVRQTAFTIYHPVGTCKMGGDALAVVDPRLRVRGVEGLRVADASVMPKIVRGNTNAPTFMIAEKAADLIRGA